MVTKNNAEPLKSSWWSSDGRIDALNADRRRLGKPEITASEAAELYRMFCFLARTMYRRYR